jgi:hypothetical protein
MLDWARAWFLAGVIGEAKWSAKPSIDLTRDPRPGTEILLPAVDASGRPIEKDVKPAILVVAGNCTECSVRGLHPKWISGPNGETIIVLFTSPPETLPSDYQRLPESYRVVCDSLGTITPTLNVAWLPRYYLLDDQFRIRDMELIQSRLLRSSR